MLILKKSFEMADHQFNCISQNLFSKNMKSVFTEENFTVLYGKMTRESEFAVVIGIKLCFMVEIDETLAIMKYSPKFTF